MSERPQREWTGSEWVYPGEPGHSLTFVTCWRPIDTAPTDGTMVIVEGGVAWFRDGCWRTITGEEYPGRPIEWEVRYWMPFPDLKKQYQSAWESEQDIPRISPAGSESEE